MKQQSERQWWLQETFIAVWYEEIIMRNVDTITRNKVIITINCHSCKKKTVIMIKN